MTTGGMLSLLAGRVAHVRSERPNASGSDSWIEVVVVDVVHDALRIETRDDTLAGLDGQQLVAHVRWSDGLMRVDGRLRVMIASPLPVVAMLIPDGPPEVLQRREWVRVRVSAPVELEIEMDATDGAPRVRTTTTDLSGGGLRLSDAGPYRGGDRLRLTVWLPSGPVEVEGDVLERFVDGSARVRFVPPSEAVLKRIVRCVFDAQVGTSRRH